MRSISFRDLKLIPELSRYNEIELIHPSNEELMLHWLGKIGFDTDYSVMYLPSKHRDMQNKVAVGFRAVGEISLNRGFVNSPMCSLVERMAVAGYTDRSLAQEMAERAGKTVDVQAISDREDLAGPSCEDFTNDMIEPDWKEVEGQIRALEDIRDQLRGPIRNSAGAYKTPTEYEEYFDVKPFYEEK